MRQGVLLTAALFALAPVGLQAQAADPTAAVAGGGVLIDGWTARVDKPADKVSDLKLEKMGPGMHITGGPHAIYYSPANVAKGNYTVKATLSKTKATPHEESYGLFIGGSKLDADNQNYLYCVVFGGGNFMVRHRFGGELHTLQAKTMSDAAAKASAQGTARDEIAMSVTSDKVSCAINGKEVWSMARADAVGPGKLESTDGVYGLRASHNLSIHVSNFGMTQNP
jgi:hypothetical protein